MKKYYDVLKKCALFDGIADTELDKMLGCLGARVEKFDRKAVIFSEGSPANYLGIVLSGSAQLVQVDYYGNRSILLAVEKSEMFAEAFACAGVDVLPVSVVANEPCEVMIINSDHILHTCSNNCSFHQRMIFNLMKELASMSLVYYQKIDVVSKRTTREKLLAYLSFCAKKAGSNKFEIPFDRQALADYLEVERSGLSAEISKMKKDGIIGCSKNRFELF